MSLGTLERLQTARLTCERLCADHASELSTLLSDARMARTLWARSMPPSRRDMALSLAAKLDHWEEHGFGMWLVRDRATAEMVGRGGLQYTYVAELDEIEAGWAIVPERWGQGLATELALACVEVAFGELELSEIVAFTLPSNLASCRVMEKTGFAYEREIIHVGIPHVLYRRDRDQR